MTATAKLIASTLIHDVPALEEAGYALHEPAYGNPAESDADELAEFAGRLCYLSFKRPNPATATNQSYLGHILDIGHESVLEHSTASFLIHASRSVLTELERHRHLSFSVVSQRYVDPTTLGVHVPPAIQAELDKGNHTPYDRLVANRYNAARCYEGIVNDLTAAGLPRKQSREAARAVLPNMTNSPMLVTGNLRAWRYVIGARYHEAADAEIRELMEDIIAQLRGIAPNTFQDIPFEPFSY